MENKENSMIDQLSATYDIDKWLMTSGMVSSIMKNDLFSYGAIAHPWAVLAVELEIDVEKKEIRYFLFLKKRMIWLSNLYNKYKQSKSVFKMAIAVLIYKKYKNLDFNAILNKFIKDRCGKGWSAKVELKNIKGYINNGIIS